MEGSLGGGEQQKHRTPDSGLRTRGLFCPCINRNKFRNDRGGGGARRPEELRPLSRIHTDTDHQPLPRAVAATFHNLPISGTGPPGWGEK